MSARTPVDRARAQLVWLCFGSLLWSAGASRARADEPVDTGRQALGVAPRLELELGGAFAMGLGHACRKNPDAVVTVTPMAGSGDMTAEPATDAAPMTMLKPAKDTCTSAFGMLGGQAVALFRPFNHWALGARFAYDAVLGSHDVYVDGMGGQASYDRHAVHLAAQLRWYSRRVMPGGFYLGVHAGVLWWTDKLDKVAANGVTRSMPELGVELGGLFAPYRGPGMTMALQGWVALFPDDPAAESSNSGTTFDYSSFVFIGVVTRVALGVSL